jgi:hypothetical protein
MVGVGTYYRAYSFRLPADVPPAAVAAATARLAPMSTLLTIPLPNVEP